MAEIRVTILEQRIAMLENELREANGLICSFDTWRRHVVRRHVAMLGGLAALLLVVGLVVPTPGAPQSTVRAPFKVIGENGATLMEVEEGSNGGGGQVLVGNKNSKTVAGLVTDSSGNGLLVVATPDKGTQVRVSPYSLNLVWNQKPIASLEHSTQNAGSAELNLYNNSFGLSVRAGTNNSGHGYVVAATNGLARFEAKPFTPSAIIGP